MPSQNASSVHSNAPPSPHNLSAPSGCIRIISEMEFLPWDNPDNIVKEHVEKDSLQVKFVVLQVLFLVGGPGNIINMVVFFKQGLRDRFNLLLFSLSLADELFLVVAMILYVEGYYVKRDKVGEISSVIAFFVNSKILTFWGINFVSFILSTIIACERCYCVVRPLRYQTLMSTRTMAFIIVAVFLVTLGLRLLVVFRYHATCFYNPDTGIALTVFSHTEFYLRHIDLIDTVENVFFGAGLPVVTMIVVIIATSITTSKLRQAMAWRSETSLVISPREVALTKILIGTSVLLIICVFPSCLFRVVCLFFPEINTAGRKQNLYLTCLWTSEIFLLINSSFNIIIYYAMGSRYRETFWGLFKRNTIKQIDNRNDVKQ